MQATFTTECIQATFTYPFKDPEGVKKLLIGSLLMLIGMFFPPVMILMYGYAAQAMRRIIIKGDAPSLPTWDAWDRLLRDGLKLFGAALLYTGPAWGIFLISMVIPIPCVILQILATEDMPWLNLLTLLSVVTQILGFILGPALASFAGLFLAPAQCHIVATGRFVAAFEVKGWWPILKAALADFGIAYLLIAMMSVFVVIVTQVLAITMIFCFLWPFLIAPLNTYIMVIGQTLIAQAYRAGVQKIAD